MGGKFLEYLPKLRNQINPEYINSWLTGAEGWGEVDDQKLADLTFENIRKIKMEKNILITKSISWLLRDLIKNNKSRVEKYLEEDADTLPKIAVRKVRKKLLTGNK